MSEPSMLEQIAQRFELYASDQRAMMLRTKNRASKDRCVDRAKHWEEAAAELRKIGVENRESFKSEINKTIEREYNYDRVSDEITALFI